MLYTAYSAYQKSCFLVKQLYWPYYVFCHSDIQMWSNDQKRAWHLKSIAFSAFFPLHHKRCLWQNINSQLFHVTSEELRSLTSLKSLHSSKNPSSKAQIPNSEVNQRKKFKEKQFLLIVNSPYLFLRNFAPC